MHDSISVRGWKQKKLINTYKNSIFGSRFVMARDPLFLLNPVMNSVFGSWR